MVKNHYRWDFIGLSTDTKPTPETSEKVVDGSTFYTSDNSKLYVWCKDNWYEKTVSGGGGGTSNFNQLTNRPKFNGVTMTGDTDIPEDFKVLTDDDANYTDPNSGDEYIALWLLPTGRYTLAEDATIEMVTRIADDIPGDGGGASVNPVAFITSGGEGGYADILFLSSQASVQATVSYDTGISVEFRGISYPFVATDGVTDGIAGLVPAPTAADDGKFLKADGSWGSPGGSSAAVVLTSADNNYHSTGDTDDGIAVWKLDRGYYKVIGAAKVYWTTSYFDTLPDGSGVLFIIGAVNDKGITGSRQVIRPGARVTGSDHFKGFYTWSVSSNGVSTDYDPATKDGYFLSGENVVSTTGNSNSNVMSQNATTTMVYADPQQRTRIQLGSNTYAGGIASTAIGQSASAQYAGSVAIGAGAVTSAIGELNIGLSNTGSVFQQSNGYNGTPYRLLSGVYDGQTAHDAATKGQLDAISSYSETEVNTGATWIDGKPIYKKSYQHTITVNSGASTFSLGITNLYEIVKIEAIWHVGGTLTNGLPTTFSTINGLENTISIMTYGGTVEISSSGRKDTTGVLTFYYTKSS